MDVCFYNFVTMIPFVNLSAQYKAHENEIKEAIEKIFISGSYIGGPEVLALEKELSSYTQIPYVISCASGTDALFLALEALGLEAGDEVILPDFSFIAPAEAVRALGGIPVFCDIDPKTFLIDDSLIEKLISPKTKGIIAVDLFGQCAPYQSISEICRRNNLWLLEDAAQSFGASQNGKKAGTFGDIAITSFYPTKPLGCYGDGGALFTHSKEIADHVRSLANHGSSSRYHHEIIGKNSRLDAIQASILRIKLKYLDDELSIRGANASQYNSFFSSMKNIWIPEIRPENVSTYAQYTLQALDRKHIESLLQENDIPYCIHYPKALQKQPCFIDLKKQTNPMTELACNQVFSLPICAFSDVSSVIKKLNGLK